MRRTVIPQLLFATGLMVTAGMAAQVPTAPTNGDPLAPRPAMNVVNAPTMSPGVVELLTLEGRFSDDVAKGGGAAFSSWFADDAVTLNNGKPAVLGHTAIAAAANWDPRQYQLTWYAEGAQVGPSGDTGFTWGHYDAQTHDVHGQPVTLSGRYITFWKKVKGQWKVALDASANDAPSGGDCCKLPTP